MSTIRTLVLAAVICAAMQTGAAACGAAVAVARREPPDPCRGIHLHLARSRCLAHHHLLHGQPHHHA